MYVKYAKLKSSIAGLEGGLGVARSDGGSPPGEASPVASAPRGGAPEAFRKPAPAPDPPAPTLDALRAEKRTLQVTLREFERTFEAREGRKVQTVSDIEGVLHVYQRYKTLKSQLSEREAGGAAGGFK